VSLIRGIYIGAIAKDIGKSGGKGSAGKWFFETTGRSERVVEWY